MKFTEKVRSVWNYYRDLGNLNSSTFLNWIKQGGKKSKGAKNEATYFTCLRMLSESLGKLPLRLYQVAENGTKRIPDMKRLMLRPNPNMDAATFWATVETMRTHHGNAFIYINRHRNKIKNLWILPSKQVEIIIDDAGVFKNENAVWYQFTNPDNGEKYLFHADQILHFKMSVSADGIHGVSVQERLNMMIEGALAAQDFLTNLNKEGLTAKAVLQYTSDLNEKSEKVLLDRVIKYATGANNAGKIFPLGPGMQIQPLDIKLTDAQFLELRKLSALQIAAAFGVKPNHLNDYEKSSYANSESQNLAFYTDTLLYIIKHYEEEMTYKLLNDAELENGLEFKFDVSVILRTDQKTQAEIMKGYVNNGIMTPNEVRHRLDMEDHEHGDKLVMNGNYIPLEMVGTQWHKNEMKGGGE